MNDKSLEWVTLGISLATLVAVVKIAAALQKADASVSGFTDKLPDFVKKGLGI